MNSTEPHLGLSYDETLGPALTEDLQAAAAAAGLRLRVDVRSSGRPMASLIWLAPTAVMVLAAKAYFESLMKELGKLHAPDIDRSLRDLARRASSLPLRKISAKPTVDPREALYSLGYSLWTERKQGGRLKLLFPAGADAAVIDEANAAYMVFLQAYHAGTLDPEDVAILDKAQPISNIVLLAYDPSSSTIQVVDPLAHLREAANE